MLFSSDIEKRIGKVKFYVAGPIWPEVLRAIQRECAVLRCEYQVADGCFHMDLLHPDFDIVDPYKKVPHYTATLSDNGGFEVIRTGFVRE